MHITTKHTTIKFASFSLVLKVHPVQSSAGLLEEFLLQFLSPVSSLLAFGSTAKVRILRFAFGVVCFHRTVHILLRGK